MSCSNTAETKESRQASCRAENRQAIFQLLASERITSIKVDFDGEDGFGDIFIRAYRDGVHADLPNAAVQFKSICDAQGIVADVTLSLADAIQTFCLDILDTEMSGWNINDGSFGEITLDVASKSMNLIHSERVMEYITTEREL